jgi:hypothetical protein
MRLYHFLFVIIIFISTTQTVFALEKYDLHKSLIESGDIKMLEMLYSKDPKKAFNVAGQIFDDNKQYFQNIVYSNNGRFDQKTSMLLVRLFNNDVEMIKNKINALKGVLKPPKSIFPKTKVGTYLDFSLNRDFHFPASYIVYPDGKLDTTMLFIAEKIIFNKNYRTDLFVDEIFLILAEQKEFDVLYNLYAKISLSELLSDDSKSKILKKAVTKTKGKLNEKEQIVYSSFQLLFIPTEKAYRKAYKEFDNICRFCVRNNIKNENINQNLTSFCEYSLLKGYLDAGQLVEILDEYNSLLDRDRLAKKVCDYTKGKASQMFSNGQYEKTQTLIDVTKNQISRISPQYAKQNVFRDLEAKILDIKRTNQNKLERKRADARLNKLIRSFM